MRRALFAVCLALALSAAAAAQSRAPTLRPSNILDELKRHKARHPRLSDAALARHANALLARMGFDYDFDSCELFPPELKDGGARVRNGGTGALYTFRRRLTRLDGRGVTFDLVADDLGAPCGECYITVPALRVTRGGMTLVAAGGVLYGLKRPASFRLDEAQLLDPSMKRVLRSWHLPFQAVPVGISPDGRRLYLDFYVGVGPGDLLLLELSEDGRARFRARALTDLGRGESITDLPPNPDDAYEGYKRFRVGGRTHVVRFTGPCT